MRATRDPRKRDAGRQRLIEVIATQFVPFRSCDFITMNDSYDCMVLGGGPAGSTVAALVAEAGQKTLLLEREKFPRFHIGESLMPETYWTLKRLGVLDKMKSGHFHGSSACNSPATPAASRSRFISPNAIRTSVRETWQVLRSEFDEMLFKNAAEKRGRVPRSNPRAGSGLRQRQQRATGVRIENGRRADREDRGPSGRRRHRPADRSSRTGWAFASGTRG